MNLILGVILRWTNILSRGGVEILLVTSCYRNRDKRQPDRPFGSYADFTSTSELLFASFSDQVLVQNVSHENDLIFMRMNERVTHIWKMSKVNLEFGYSFMSWHREPLILRVLYSDKT